MAHFTIAVLSYDRDEVDMLVAPYDDSLEVAVWRGDDGSLWWENPNGKFDWYEIGYGYVREWAIENFGFVSGKIKDLKTLNFDEVYAFILPDGSWVDHSDMMREGLLDKQLSDDLTITFVNCHC